MGSQIHYEIFRRVGAKGGWSLHDVRNGREDAIDHRPGADGRREGHRRQGGQGNLQRRHRRLSSSLKIFEDGHNQVKVDPKAEDAPHALPCFKPDDLYSYHARATIARLLARLPGAQPDHRHRAVCTAPTCWKSWKPPARCTSTPSRKSRWRRPPSHHDAGAADRQEPERTHHQGDPARLSRPAQRHVSQSGAGAYRAAGGEAGRQADAPIFSTARWRAIWRMRAAGTKKSSRLLTLMDSRRRRGPRKLCCRRWTRSWRKCWPARRRCMN